MTGAAGFIGSRATEALLTQGHSVVGSMNVINESVKSLRSIPNCAKSSITNRVGPQKIGLKHMADWARRMGPRPLSQFSGIEVRKDLPGELESLAQFLADGPALSDRPCR
ncbi:MAG: NAD-dependent epimerase/dehydratase family protein [Tepidisphaeraceae bacterium]